MVHKEEEHMRTYLKIGMIISSFICLALSPVVRETSPSFIRMEVRGVNVDLIGQKSVVILVDKEEKKALPMWIGVVEASAVERELKGLPAVRPMTHDLLHSILKRTRVQVKEVEITDLKDNIYYASLFLNSNREMSKSMLDRATRSSLH